jgi:hypothetical protein
MSFNLFATFKKLLAGGEPSGTPAQHAPGLGSSEAGPNAQDEVTSLMKRVEELETENRFLLSRLAETDSHAPELPDRQVADLPREEHRILLLLRAESGSTDDRIGQRSGLGFQFARYFLGQLEAARLVRRSQPSGRPPEWHLTGTGLKYLAERGLLQG